jgi:hypothetical protein
MSARFLATSSQRLTNSSPPVVTMPFTVGFWCQPTVSSTAQSAWAMCDPAGTHFYGVTFISSGTQVELQQNSGATTSEVIASFTYTLGQWVYCLLRCIGAADKRLTAMNHTGLVASINSVTSKTPTVTTVDIGALGRSAPIQLWSGYVAEYFITNTDIQPGGGAMQESLLRQLAFGGPFSVPHIAADILDYQAFRSALGSDTAVDTDGFYDAPKGQQIWTNTNTVGLGPHPPLPGNYADLRVAGRSMII